MIIQPGRILVSSDEHFVFLAVEADTENRETIVLELTEELALHFGQRIIDAVYRARLKKGKP